MSSSAYAPHLSIERRPSLRLAVFLTAAHAGAAGALVAAPAPLWLRLVLFAAVVVSLAHGLATHALLRGPRAVRELTWGPEGEWALLRGGERIAARLLGTSFVHPRLAVLNFRLARGRSAVILPFDGLDPEVFRRLRVRLALERLGADAEQVQSRDANRR